MMYFQYHVDEHITLELQSPFQARELFDLVNENRKFIGQHLSWVRKIHTIKDIKHYMARDLTGMVQERRYAWIIRYKGQIAGRIGLFVTVPSLHECELYYFLGREFTGKGIVTEAAKTVIDFAFNVLHLKHVLIGFTAQNPKSGAVAERLGFQFEYTMRDAEMHEAEWRSLHFWGMLEKDWQSKNMPAFEYPLDDNLSLRLYQPFQSDIKYNLLRANQSEFSQWFWWANNRFTLAKEKDIARKLLKRYARRTGIGVTIWQDNVMVGNASTSIDPDSKSGDVGYWLDQFSRGKGIMTRTVQALLDDAFSNYSIERMGILAAVANQGSRAIAERLGMQLELIQKDETVIQGQFVDHVQYSILRDEWKEKRV